VTRKATKTTAIPATPRMAFNRLPTFPSMSRRAFLFGVALLLSGAVAPHARGRHLEPDRPQRAELSLPATLPQRTITLPILMYHLIGRITPDEPAITQPLTVTPDDFAAEMLWLKHNGFHAVSQEQAFEALELGAKLPPHPSCSPSTTAIPMCGRTRCRS
jgi:hypothetical protein